MVTLPSKKNLVEAARQLMDTRGLAKGSVIDVSGKISNNIQDFQK